MSHVKFVFSSFDILHLNILTCENKITSHVNKWLAPHVEFTFSHVNWSIFFGFFHIYIEDKLWHMNSYQQQPE